MVSNCSWMFMFLSKALHFQPLYLNSDASETIRTVMLCFALLTRTSCTMLIDGVVCCISLHHVYEQIGHSSKGVTSPVGPELWPSICCCQSWTVSEWRLKSSADDQKRGQKLLCCYSLLINSWEIAADESKTSWPGLLRWRWSHTEAWACHPSSLSDVYACENGSIKNWRHTMACVACTSFKHSRLFCLSH